MGRGNYLRRAGLPFVRLILAAVLLGGAVSQAVAQELTLSTGEMETFSFTLTAPSSIKPFTITAIGLKDDVIVSAPSQFEVSKLTTPTVFQNSISFSPFEFSLAGPTAVLVRMKAQTLTAPVSGVVINVSTTGVITQTVALTGTLSGWTYAEWTNDADSGIDQNNYYTHKYALSGSGDVRVNGVTFTSVAGNSATGLYMGQIGLAVDPTPDFSSRVEGSSAGLVSKYRAATTDDGPMEINLSGLANNTRYELSLYSSSTVGNERVLRFYSGTGLNEREIDTNLFAGMGVVAPFPDTTLLEYHGNGMRVIYSYTSDGEGNAQIKIDPATIAGTPEFFHLGALSNRQVAAAEGDFDCTTTAGKVTINAYIGTAGGVVVIPATIRGNPVTAIGNGAFASNVDHRDEITQVIIPNTVLTIGAQAFERCIGLTTMKIPNSVTRIADNAFWGCTSLQSVEVGSGVTSIGNLAFYNCSLLHDVYLAATTRPSVGLSAFSGIAAGAVGYYPAGAAEWSGVTIGGLNLIGIAGTSFTAVWAPVVGATYTIEVSTTSLFGGGDIVKTVNATASETSKLITGLNVNTNYWYRVIATNAFGDTTSSPVPVTTGETDFTYTTTGGKVTITGYTGTSGVLVIPATIGGNPVTGIAGGAFLGRTDLSSVTIPESVTSIAGSAFKDCRNLISMIIPNSVTSLGSFAFSGCGGLTSITLGNSVTDIGESTFSGCFSLSSIIIGSSVNSIGKQAFYDCQNLAAITIPSSVTIIGQQAFDRCYGLTSVTIGSGVATIGTSAFQNCRGLTSLTIPNNVTSMGSSAFSACSGLTRLTIGSGLTSIASGTFSACTSLTSVTIPNTVITIGDNAFNYNIGLTSVTIGSGVTSIGAQAFKDCAKLAMVNFLKSSPPSVDVTSFYRVAAGAIGYYPAGAAGWSGVPIAGLNLVSMPSGITGTSFTAVWAPVVGATYTIEVSTTPLFGGVDIVRTVNATASETSKVITGLNANTNYWYRVIATIASGATTTSSSVPVTTGAAELPIPAAPVLTGLPATMVYQQKVVLAGAVSALQRTTSTPTAIPDYNGAGISQTMTIAGLTAGTNYQVNLGINLSALDEGVLGDLKMYLRHTLVSGGVTMVDQTRILLDRVGVVAGDLGSLATGLNVIMSDSGASNIQSSDTPAHSGTPLTGTWQPASLLGGTSFGLSTMGTKSDGSFNWNGDWALVVADLANGGTMRLDSWSMQFSDLSASDTSVETAGLEYELVPPLSGPAKASISKNELEALSGTGTFQVRARYRAVDGISQVSAWTTQTITLTKKGQTIAFAALGTRSLAPAFMAGASSDSGLPLTYSSSNAGTATIDGVTGQITPVAEGTTTISVAQAGDENFSGATTVSQLLTIASTPLNPAWGLSKLFSQDSTNSAVAGVTKGTNTYAYTKIEYAEASAAAQIRIVPISFGGTQVANLTQTNEVALGVIGYSSPSNPASFTSYSAAATAVPAGYYTFVGKNASNEVVTNAVVNWSNNTNDYPVQAPQIGGTWVAQSLRLANPANPNTISWLAWTNTPVVGSTNSIRVEVTGNLLSISSPATVKFVTNLPANSTSLEIPAGALPINQAYSAKVGFVTMTGGAARSTETQFRMVTGPMNPPAKPVLLGALIGNINVAPGSDVVGILAAFSDLDAGDTETLSLPTFTFPDANDNNLFVLDGRTIKLALGKFDYATQPFYSILVRATDSYGLYSETTYTVSVQGTQTITFNDLATKTFGDVPFDLTATASGGAVTYTSSNTGVATISGSTVTIKGAGFTDITASQAGGGAYLAAIPVVKRLTVNKATQTISGLASTDSKIYLDADYTLSVTKGASTSALSFASSAPGVATINSTTGLVHIVGAGTATLTVNQAADANYNAASAVTQTLTVSPAGSTITVTGGTSFIYTGSAQGPDTSTTTGSSGAVTYMYAGTGGTSYGPSPTKPTVVGNYTVTAGMASSANYGGATSSPTAFTITKATQAITGLAGTDSKTYGAVDYTLSVTQGASTSALTYASSAPGVATINSTTGLVHIVGAGTATLTVNQAADANYNAATQVSQTLTVGRAVLTIKADSNSRGYGAENPALTGSLESGAVLGESFVVTASTTATASSAPGSYSIVPDVTGATLSNYTVSKINGTLTVTSAPFAGEDALTAAPAPSSSTKYSFAQLLLNDSTYAGTLSITGVAAISGVTQGTVSTKGSWVVYVPKAGALAGATDSFNYTLSNGTSMTMGRVTISLVSPDMTISVALASPPTVANGYKATFLVMPGLVFEAYGSDTVGGAYVKIGTTFTSASSGKLEVTDSGAGASRFYKLKWIP
ncbi:MAG: leucine-rich repeat protein [Aliarcobacter sp.]